MARKTGRDALNEAQQQVWDAVPLMSDAALRSLVRRMQGELRARKASEKPTTPWNVVHLDAAMAAWVPGYTYPANGVGVWPANVRIGKIVAPHTWAGTRVDGVKQEELVQVAQYLAQDETWMSRDRSRDQVLYFLEAGGIVRVRKWAKNRRAYY